MKRLTAAVHAAFHRPDTALHRWVQGTVWTLIALSVALFLVELSRELKRRHGVLLLGLRVAGGEDRVNPPDDTPVPAGTELIYLAEQPVLPEQDA